jgi:hypothetical protein
MKDTNGLCRPISCFVVEFTARCHRAVRDEKKVGLGVVDSRIDQVGWLKSTPRTFPLRAFILMLSAGFLVVTGPEKVVPVQGEVIMSRLVTKVLDMAVVSLVARAPLAVGATLPLEFEEPLTDDLLLGAV